jgi:hypothetical protein
MSPLLARSILIDSTYKDTEEYLEILALIFVSLRSLSRIGKYYIFLRSLGLASAETALYIRYLG